MKKQLLLIGVVAVVASMFYAVANNLPRSGTVEPGRSDDGSESGPASLVELSNPRKLLGITQNVFAAKIIKEVGRAPGVGGMSRVQFDAEVIYNIKGVANNPALINQSLMEGRPLAIGATYLFAAINWNGADNFVGPQGEMMVLVSQDSSLTKEQLLDLVLRHPRSYELLNAYPNEIIVDTNPAHGAIRNGFQFLTDAEKEAVYAKFQELIPPRRVPDQLPQPVPPAPKPPEEKDDDVCKDGRDNDSDGLVDKSDPDCTPFLREDLPVRCRDTADNDLDGLTDAADPDCAPFYPKPAPPPPPPAPLPPPPPQEPSSTPPAAPPPPPPQAPSSTPTST